MFYKNGRTIFLLKIKLGLVGLCIIIICGTVVSSTFSFRIVRIYKYSRFKDTILFHINLNNINLYYKDHKFCFHRFHQWQKLQTAPYLQKWQFSPMSLTTKLFTNVKPPILPQRFHFLKQSHLVFFVSSL